MKYQDLIIGTQETLKDAMQAMTANKKGILFVCHDDGVLAGVLSDGDIRRAVLNETLPQTPVKKVMNVSPVTATNLEEAKGHLEKSSFIAVPVVGAGGVVAEILVKQDQGNLSLKAEGVKTTKSDTQLDAVALIPARGGSKRILRKNLVMVAGKPLLGWTILAAKKAKNIGSIIVSTDDPEIAEYAKSLGVEVPWMRPKELAEDSSPTLDVVLHALEQLKDKPQCGGAVLLEPTAPLRLPEHIDMSVEKLVGSDADSVVSVSQVPHVVHPEELVIVENDQLKPFASDRNMDNRRLRGKQDAVFVQNGLVYAMKIDSVLQQKSLYGKKSLPSVIDWEYFLDVDTEQDLKMADYRIRQLQAAKKID